MLIKQDYLYFSRTTAIEAHTGHYHVQILGNFTRSDVYPILHVQRYQQRGCSQKQNEAYRPRNRPFYLHVIFQMKLRSVVLIIL